MFSSHTNRTNEALHRLLISQSFSFLPNLFIAVSRSCVLFVFYLALHLHRLSFIYHLFQDSNTIISSTVKMNRLACPPPPPVAILHIEWRHLVEKLQRPLYSKGKSNIFKVTLGLRVSTDPMLKTLMMSFGTASSRIPMSHCASLALVVFVLRRKVRCGAVDMNSAVCQIIRYGDRTGYCSYSHEVFSCVCLK